MRAAAALLLFALPLPAAAQGQTARARRPEAEIARLEGHLARLRKDLAALRLAGRKARPLSPGELAVGQVGWFASRGPSGTLYWDFRVEQVIDADQAVVRHVGVSTPPFIVKASTRGLVGDKQITLPGTWEVKEARKRRGRTYHVVERISPGLPAPLTLAGPPAHLPASRAR
jgi:hypothetical protein